MVEYVSVSDWAEINRQLYTVSEYWMGLIFNRDKAWWAYGREFTGKI